MHHNLKHGHSTTGNISRTYRTWTTMKNRCNDPNATNYKNWGGKGITVCERWLLFDNFLTDMGERPEGKSLDRIDSNGNYEPSNCRWATAKQQANNRKLKFDHKLTESKVKDIKVKLYLGSSPLTLSKEYNVSRQLIYEIERNYKWNKVKLN